jgi:hypothetical protein
LLLIEFQVLNEPELQMRIVRYSPLADAAGSFRPHFSAHSTASGEALLILTQAAPDRMRAATFLRAAPSKQEVRRYKTNKRSRRSASFSHQTAAKFHLTDLFASLAERFAPRCAAALRNAPLRIATHNTFASFRI